MDRAKLAELVREVSEIEQLKELAEAADQIEADGKRIAELENSVDKKLILITELAKDLLEARQKLEAADTRALAAAEAVKEAAAMKSDSFSCCEAISERIRAIDCNAIVKGMK